MMTSARRSAGGGSSQGSPSSRGGGSPGNSIQSGSAPGHSPGTPTPSRIFCISVVGLSGTERDKGTVGAGKSCLCNRFVRPLEDDYFTDHISTLCQVDFSGSPVINNDHWLYWGERSLLIGPTGESDSGNQRVEWGFRVVEQTEFVDDESFQTLKGSGPNQKDGYLKRAVATRLHSPDKLMYVCKDQLGLETEYEQKQINSEGRISVDGFVCVFDISVVPKRSFQNQAEFVAGVLQQIAKAAKKPVVLVLTKCDEGTQEGFREYEKLLSKKELRGLSIPVVETSAHNNVNVDAAFMILGHLIDAKASRGISKPKVFPYREASKFRKEVLEVAGGAYARKLKMAVQDYRVTWHQWTRQFGHDSDFVHFCELFGAAQAQKVFRHHQKELRDEYMKKRLQSQSNRLPEVLERLLPDYETVKERSWEDVIGWIQAHPQFQKYFQPIGTLADSLDQPQEIHDPRLPAELLFSSEAENMFKNHHNALQTEFTRRRLEADFELILSECSQVTPGKPLSDVRIFLQSRESFEALPDAVAQEIYDRYQRQLIKRARLDFVELLLENVEELVSRILFPHNGNSTGSGNRIPGLSERDMHEIHDKLQEDRRYRQLNRLHQARDNMICQYASFVSYPLRQHCPAGSRCIDSLIEQLLANRIQRPNPYSLEFCENGNSSNKQDELRQLNLAVLGNFGLPDQLVREIRLHLPHDLYPDAPIGSYPNSSGACPLFAMAYKTIDGDVRQPKFSLATRDFKADAVIAVFSSRETLEFVRDSLAHLLLMSATTESSDPENLVPPGLLSGELPVILILACDPNHLDDLPYLQQQGSLLAESLRCPFVGVGGPMGDKSPRRSDVASGPSLFTGEQVVKLFEGLHGVLPRKTEKDAEKLRLVLCLMCGDEQPPQGILNPLLNHQVSGEYSMVPRSNPEYGHFHPEHSTVTIETFLPSSGKKIRAELRLAAYHTAFLMMSQQKSGSDQDFDGYVLVYSARRLSSLRHLDALAHLVPDPIPILLVAVGEVTEFFSDKATNALITEGNDIADRIGARFVTVSPAVEQQMSSYTSFFEEVYLKKMETVKFRNSAFPPVQNGHFYLGENPENGKHLENEIMEQSESEYAPLSEFQSGYWPTESERDQQMLGRDGPWREEQIQQATVTGVGNEAGAEWEGEAGTGISEQRVPGSAGILGQQLGTLGHGGIGGSSSTGASPRLWQRNAQGSKTPEEKAANFPAAPPGRLKFFGRIAGRKQQVSSSTTQLESQESLSKSDLIVPAPLATPENIEIGVEYMTVKDALNRSTDFSSEDDPAYATLDSINVISSENRPLPPPRPPRKLDGNIGSLEQCSSSEGDASLEKMRENAPSPYERTGRKPTPHKRHKKHPTEHSENASSSQSVGSVGPGIAERLRQLNSELESSVEGPTVALWPSSGPGANDGNQAGANGHVQVHRHFRFMSPSRSGVYEPQKGEKRRVVAPSRIRRKINPTHPSLVRFRSASEESLLEPVHRKHVIVQTANQHPPEEDCANQEPEKSFVRKVASSFRFRRKKSVGGGGEMRTEGEGSGSRSVPQSPLLPRTGLSAAIEGGVFVLPPAPFEPWDVDTPYETGNATEAKLQPNRSSERLLLPPQVESPVNANKSPKKSTSSLWGNRKQSSDAVRKKSSSGSLNLMPHGATLRDLVASPTDPVPMFVRKCVEFIETEGGLSLEGLYRVPGNQAQVALLEQKFSENPDVKFEELDIPVNAVATSLKNFFSYLADPVVSFLLYDDLVFAMQSRENQMKFQAVKLVLKRLPKENREVLKFFISHLKKVADHAHMNSMDLRNLAKCWWPTLLRPHFDSFESMAQLTPRLEEFAQLLFDHSDTLL